jgi:peptide-methionine (S)-S-oxide reductase
MKNTENKTGPVVLGGGCFWCTEAIFKSLRGVIAVTPGYAGGSKENPGYEGVSSGETGHAEVVKVEFDPDVIPYRDLLEIFWEMHDPTTIDRQGNDVGSQYRSLVLYTTEEQKRVAEELKEELNRSEKYTRAVVTEIKPLEKFWKAEEYHKNYYEKHQEVAYCRLIISPKLTHLRQKYGKKLKGEH